MSVTAEYIFLRQALGLDLKAEAAAYCRYLLSQQNSDGSWGLAPEYPGDVSTSTEAYLALKILGTSPHIPAMWRARAFVLKSGGIARVRVFTRIFLATFGLFPWRAVPELPVELMLLSSICPINIYKFASWARGTIAPLLIICHHQPVYSLPNGKSASNDYLDELWLDCTNKNVPYGLPLWELMSQREFAGLAFGVLDIRLPGRCVDRMRKTVLQELAVTAPKGAKMPFLSEGDVVVAWWVRTMTKALKPAPDRTIMVMNVFNVWNLFAEWFPNGAAGLIGISFFYSYTLLVARNILQDISLNYVASTNRKALVEHRTKQQVEAMTAIQRGNFMRAAPMVGDSKMLFMAATNQHKARYLETDWSEAVIAPGVPLSGRPHALGRPSYINDIEYCRGYPTRNIVRIIGKDAAGDWHLLFKAKCMAGDPPGVDGPDRDRDAELICSLIHYPLTQDPISITSELLATLFIWCYSNILVGSISKLNGVQIWPRT